MLFVLIRFLIILWTNLLVATLMTGRWGILQLLASENSARAMGGLVKSRRQAKLFRMKPLGRLRLRKPRSGLRNPKSNRDVTRRADIGGGGGGGRSDKHNGGVRIVLSSLFNSESLMVVPVNTIPPTWRTPALVEVMSLICFRYVRFELRTFLITWS